MIFAGLLSALGLLFLIFKFGVRRVIAYDIPIDITVTALLIYTFAGTYSGMIAAMVGGLVVSVTLYIMKRTMRREEFRLVKTSTFPYRAMRWVGVQP
jgi:ABC-type enterobactin transport system permease subunit